MEGQQEQTLAFFDGHAEEWRAKADGEVPKVNVIAQRHAAVLRAAEGIDELRRHLDIGCGTGDLAIELASRGVEAIGVDYAPEMIRICNERNTHPTASFVCASFFEHDAGGPFDLVSAMGFIEYISPAQTSETVRRAYDLVRPGGLFVVASRNRLFNLFSLNDYTRLELELGTVVDLLDEAVALASGDLASLRGRRIDYPHPERHPGTGIGVAVRYQYTPAQLVSLVEEHGFTAESIYPVNYHALHGDATRTYQPLHVRVAEVVGDDLMDDASLVPSSSTFVLAARR